jgi:hypothetical protein
MEAESSRTARRVQTVRANRMEHLRGTGLSVRLTILQGAEGSPISFGMRQGYHALGGRACEERVRAGEKW